MRKLKIIEMTGNVLAECVWADGKIFELYKDLPPGSKVGDNLIQDNKGKLHICNIEIPPAD